MSKPKTAIEKIEWLQGERSIGRFRVKKSENDDLSTLLNQIITAIKKEKKQVRKEQREIGVKEFLKRISKKDDLPEVIRQYFSKTKTHHKTHHKNQKA